jgi:Arc/MetJ family transcription regulator
MRTVIDIDEDALRLATDVLGTTTKVATVNAALRRVCRAARVLHVDKDYDQIAALTGQPMRRLATSS